MATAPSTAAPKRVLSLDALRAVTVALMIFMDHPTGREFVPVWLSHPEWHGFRLADAVFPAFIFIAGVSLAFANRSEKNAEERKAALKVFLRRIGLLFGIGLLINVAKYGLPWRFPGVLQRIALVSLIAYPFRRSSPRLILSIALALIAAHTAVLLFVGAPGIPAGSLDSETRNISGFIDGRVLGPEHTTKQQGFDPEGILGTLTSAATMLIGLATGRVLAERGQDRTTLARLWGVGAVTLGAGIASGVWIVPVNKKLWTGSFTLLSAGLFIMILVTVYALTDLRGKTAVLEPFVPLGRNALAMYIGSNAFLALALNASVTGGSGDPVILLRAIGGLSRRYLDPTAATLLISGAEVVFWALVAAWMHKRKIYIKL